MDLWYLHILLSNRNSMTKPMADARIDLYDRPYDCSWYHLIHSFRHEENGDLSKHINGRNGQISTELSRAVERFTRLEFKTPDAGLGRPRFNVDDPWAVITIGYPDDPARNAVVLTNMAGYATDTEIYHALRDPRKLRRQAFFVADRHGFREVTYDELREQLPAFDIDKALGVLGRYTAPTSVDHNSVKPPARLPAIPAKPHTKPSPKR